MSDKYKFEKRIVVKILIENNNGELLLIRESASNDWMPGRWGLPGGKTLAKEPLTHAYARKLKEETGLTTKTDGFYGIVEILYDDRSVYIFHLVAGVPKAAVVSRKHGEYMWADKEKIESMPVEEFTEFFNRELVLEYLGGERKVYPLEILKSWNFFEMTENQEFKNWLNA